MVLGFPESSLDGKLFEVIYEQDVAQCDQMGE